MEFEAGTKSGFSSSKDHDERIAGAVSGGNEHISGRLSVAYQKFGGWFDGNGDATLLDNADRPAVLRSAGHHGNWYAEHR